MSERDDNRVEYRLSTTGRLVNATTERIEDLLRLRDDREKLSRPKPAVGFGTVLEKEQGRGGGAGGGEQEPKKERPKPPLTRDKPSPGRDARGSQAFGAATVRPSPTTRKPPPPAAKAEPPAAKVEPPAVWPRRELTQTNARVVHQGPPPKATPRPGTKGRTIIKG